MQLGKYVESFTLLWSIVGHYVLLYIKRQLFHWNVVSQLQIGNMNNSSLLLSLQVWMAGRKVQ